MRPAHPEQALWLRWTGANAAGELVGLGGVALAIALLAPHLGDLPGPLTSLGIVLLGLFEGVVVGAAQWWVLRRRLPALRARAWIMASAAGALVAWLLGMLPSTLMDLGAVGGVAGPPVEPSELTQLSLAAALGAIGGPVLALFQWRVLRRHVRRSGWWIAANALAWAAGMPLIFLVAGGVPAGGVTVAFVLLALLALAGTGAVVGAIHGVALVRLTRMPERRRPTRPG